MALFESSSDAVVSFGADGRIFTLNPRTESLFGYRAADLIDNPVAVLLASARPRPGRPAPPCEGLPPELLGGEPHVLLGRRVDGSVFAVDVLITKVEDEGGGFTIASFRNVEARAAGEEELRASEARFRAAVETLGEA
jgi:PAS domain-containing protein